MANTHSYSWTIYCQDENEYKNIYSTTEKHRPPCPDDPAHTIDLSKSSYKFESEPFKDIYNSHHKKAYHATKGHCMDCPANTTTSYDIVFPHDIFFLRGCVLSEDENQGDVLDALVGSDLLIGAAIAPANIGDEDVYVSDTVIDLCELGVIVQFAGDTTKYTITDYDLFA